MTAEVVADLRHRLAINDVFGAAEVQRLLDEREALLDTMKELLKEQREGGLPPCECSTEELAAAAIAKAEAP